MDTMMDGLMKLDSRFGDANTARMVQDIKDAHESPGEFTERLLTFGNVLKSGKFKAREYIKAVQYTSYRAQELSMKKSYMQTFPDRCYRDGKRKPEGTIDALASIYDKTQLVQGILSQMQIPLHIMMMTQRVKAANVLAHLMVNGDTERIQMESADKLLNHVKIPETIKMELDVGIKSDEVMHSIDKQLTALADLAQTKIQAGIITPIDVIEHKEK